MRIQLKILAGITIVLLYVMSGCSTLDTVNPDAGDINEIDAVIDTISVLVKTTCDAQSACITYALNPIDFGDGGAYLEDGWWKYEVSDEDGRTFMAIRYYDWDFKVQDYFDSETLWIHFRMEVTNYASGLYYKMRFFRHTQLGFTYPIWQMKGDGNFTASVYEGTLEVEESNMNSLKVPRCPNTGKYTMVFSPYLVLVNMQDVQYAFVRLNTGEEIIDFKIDKKTGEIIR